ncbi:MAG: hypothetical protein LC715_04105, partial [Gammaproteobacteria bacterium]|nr:hypothetical protein [Gammaproteobacteria bacterium]
MFTPRLQAPSSRTKAPCWTGLALGITLLTGCATYGYPGGYSQPGGPYQDRPYPGQYGGTQLVGTVQGVDPGSRRVMLATEAHGYG